MLIPRLPRSAAGLIAALLAGLAMLASANAQEDWLRVDEAFDLAVERHSDGTLSLQFQVRDGYYLYREQLRASTPGDEAPPLPLETPGGTIKNDPAFGTVEVYLQDVTARIPAEALAEAEARSDRLQITYQGCADGGICYPPVTRDLNLASLEVADAGDGGAGRSADETGSDTLGLMVADQAEGGLVGGMLERGGIALVIASFLLFGALLAFTPCVFPMFPILAGVLARDGEQLSPRRGFVLSGAYVLAMASAFGLLGVVAAWSGQNVQMALQSPYAIAGISLLFAALAFSMFGLFELQLPAAWTARISGVGTGRRGSPGSAALIGFTSALIVGPCVTAPLAGALLYIAHTGEVALGAASLFALGLGKGIPLMVFGTFGARALPRSGPWMNRVKTVFGFLFLATAVWMLSRILPPELTLALWAALAVILGVFLGAFDPLARDSAPVRRLGKASGLLATLYGALLFVGAAAGGSDPLRPLEELRAAGAPTAGSSEVGITFRTAYGAEDLMQILEEAEGGGDPALIYVTADWCISCDVIERRVFENPELRDDLASLHLIALDVTAHDAENRALMEQLQVAGPPTMIFFDTYRQEVEGTRLVGEIGPEDFLAAASKAREDAS